MLAQRTTGSSAILYFLITLVENNDKRIKTGYNLTGIIRSIVWTDRAMHSMACGLSITSLLRDAMHPRY